MKEFTLLRLLCTLLFSTLFVLPYWWSQRKKKSYDSYSGVILLPLFLPLVLLFIRVVSGRSDIGHPFLHFILSYALYSLLLLALTTPLRKHYSAKLCADLWLLPNLSYYYLISIRGLIPPFAVLRIGRTVFWGFLLLWCIGFFAVLTLRIVGHLRLRRRLLKDAVCDARLSGVYREQRGLLISDERQLRRFNSYKHVLYSPSAVSPISVGLFKKTTRIVLPQRDYTDWELRLILRHEIIHLLRKDNWIKFFLTVVTATCWFLPSMWLGLSHAAEDIELCCDELTTEDLNLARRKQYTSLLLSNAGTAPGFTTCLSATAKGLRYRLQRVLHPEKRRYGLILLILLMFLFVFSLGSVGFAPGAGSFNEALLSDYSAPDQVVLNILVNDSRQKFSFDVDSLCSVFAETSLYRWDGTLSEEIYKTEDNACIMVIQQDRILYLHIYDTFVDVEQYKAAAPGSPKGFVWNYEAAEGRFWELTSDHKYLYDTPPELDLLLPLAGEPLE